MLRNARPTRADFRALISLAVPIVAVWVGIMLMGVVDAVMVGHYSPQALAAAALGNFYFFTVAVFAMGVLFVLDPLVSQAVGAGDTPAITRAVHRGFALSVALGIPLLGPLLFVAPVLRALRQPADVIPGATTYVLVTAASLLPLLLFTVLRQTMQAMARVAPIVIAIAVANVINAVLNWVLIYGHLGARPLGIFGAALATTVSRFALVALLIFLAWKDLWPHVRGWTLAALEWAPLRSMLRIGAPIGVQQVLEVAAFSFMMIVMGWLGTTALAAHQVAINLASLTFMVPLGVGSAAAVLVGQAIGARDEARARRAAAAALICGVGFMVLSAATFLLIPAALASLYTSDRAVLTLAAMLIPIAGVFQVFDGLQVVSLGVLRGVADTRTPMAIALIGYWLLGMPAGLWLAFRTDLGPRGVWWGAVVGLASVGILLLIRVRVRLARTMARVHVDVPVEEPALAGRG
jgi:MATE family multidrug resistance protein